MLIDNHQFHFTIQLKSENVCLYAGDFLVDKMLFLPNLILVHFFIHWFLFFDKITKCMHVENFVLFVCVGVIRSSK